MNETSITLQKIAKGTGIVFAGTIFWVFFEFLSRVVIARCFSTAEYGVFNLALTVLSIVLVVATLGFQSSLPREVAFYREKEAPRVGKLISTALVIITLNSLIWTIVLILGAGKISQVFNEVRLTHALKIMAFALPFWALTMVIISISRGFGRVREQVYFRNIFYPAIFLVFVLIGAFLNFPFTYLFFAYVIAQILTLLALVFDIWKTGLFKFRILIDLKLGKELIKFSLPLLLTGILGFIMTWADTLMLGYYKSSEVVGLYNVASNIAKLLLIFLSSASFLYVPIASKLYAQERIKEMGRVYQILTKWMFLLALPIFNIIFLFPKVIISFFFGDRYVSASLALQILALGFMFHISLGLNGWSLVIIGDAIFNMIGDLFAAITNIILNVMLIPTYGLEGAAVATALSYFVANVFRSFWLYKKIKVHPFSWNYVKLLVIGFILPWVIKSLHLKVHNIWHVFPILVVFIIAYFFLGLLSRSVDNEDIDLFLIIEERLGVDMKIIKKILRRFV